jgi:trimethyllysine dioxygenase
VHCFIDKYPRQAIPAQISRPAPGDRLAKSFHSYSLESRVPRRVPPVHFRGYSNATTKAELVERADRPLLKISFGSGTDATLFDPFWLRDHCMCSTCAHPHTHQRQLDTFSLDPDIRIQSLSETGQGVEIIWSGEDAHNSTYPWSWLEKHVPVVNLNAKAPRSSSRTHYLPESEPPEVSFNDLTAPDSTKGRHDLFHNIHNHGICYITDTPPTPEATQTVLNTLGPIRHTHYGGFWDFATEAKPIDTAYTNLSLPAHTDNTYFAEPAGLQLFHLLSHAQSTAAGPIEMGTFDATLGGESIFVDGFAAAATLFSDSRDAFVRLANQKIIFSAQGSPAGPFHNTAAYRNGHPVVELANSRPLSAANAANYTTPPEVVRIRWNNLDRSSMSRLPVHRDFGRAWYGAAKKWSEILSDPQFEVQVQLRPGTPVVFDNWRILHGRRAYEGKRRMCGAYIGMDDFRAGAASLGVL